MKFFSLLQHLFIFLSLLVSTSFGAHSKESAHISTKDTTLLFDGVQGSIDRARESFENIYYALVKNNHFNLNYVNNLIINSKLQGDVQKEGLVLLTLIDWLSKQADRDSAFLLKKLNELFFLEFHRFISGMNLKKTSTAKMLRIFHDLYNTSVASDDPQEPHLPFHTSLSKLMISIHIVNANEAQYSGRKETFTLVLDNIKREMLAINSQMFSDTATAKAMTENIQSFVLLLGMHAVHEPLIKSNRIKTYLVAGTFITIIGIIAYNLLFNDKYEASRTNMVKKLKNIGNMIADGIMEPIGRGVAKGVIHQIKEDPTLTLIARQADTRVGEVINVANVTRDELKAEVKAAVGTANERVADVIKLAQETKDATLKKLDDTKNEILALAAPDKVKVMGKNMAGGLLEGLVVAPEKKAAQPAVAALPGDGDAAAAVVLEDKKEGDQAGNAIVINPHLAMLTEQITAGLMAHPKVKELLAKMIGDDEKDAKAALIPALTVALQVLQPENQKALAANMGRGLLEGLATAPPADGKRVEGAAALPNPHTAMFTEQLVAGLMKDQKITALFAKAESIDEQIKILTPALAAALQTIADLNGAPGPKTIAQQTLAKVLTTIEQDQKRAWSYDDLMGNGNGKTSDGKEALLAAASQAICALNGTDGRVVDLTQVKNALKTIEDRREHRWSYDALSGDKDGNTPDGDKALIPALTTLQKAIAMLPNDAPGKTRDGRDAPIPALLAKAGEALTRVDGINSRITDALDLARPLAQKAGNAGTGVGALAAAGAMYLHPVTGLLFGASQNSTVRSTVSAIGQALADTRPGRAVVNSAPIRAITSRLGGDTAPKQPLPEVPLLAAPAALVADAGNAAGRQRDPRQDGDDAKRGNRVALPIAVPAEPSAHTTPVAVVEAKDAQASGDGVQAGASHDVDVAERKIAPIFPGLGLGEGSPLWTTARTEPEVAPKDQTASRFQSVRLLAGPVRPRASDRVNEPTAVALPIPTPPPVTGVNAHVHAAPANGVAVVQAAPNPVRFAYLRARLNAITNRAGNAASTVRQAFAGCRPNRSGRPEQTDD